jgi:hypothetical protein
VLNVAVSPGLTGALGDVDQLVPVFQSLESGLSSQTPSTANTGTEVGTNSDSATRNARIEAARPPGRFLTGRVVVLMSCLKSAFGSSMEWRTILAKLRRARLLAGEDPHNPGHLDTHPLVREYFGEQLQSQRTEAWKECNSRLYNHYRTLAPQLPDSFRDMEPLFLAVICGCNAGLYREALHEVYIPRIQQGNTSFSANVLGAGGALVSVLGNVMK